MNRVFVIQQVLPRKDKNNWQPDIQSATKYGSIHFLFTAGDRPYLDPNSARVHLLAKLRDFDPEKDWLLDLRMGDPAAFWEAHKLLMALGKEPRMLYWSRGLDKEGKMSNDQGFYIAYEPPSIYDFLKQHNHNKVKDSYEENENNSSKEEADIPGLGKRTRRTTTTH